MKQNKITRYFTLLLCICTTQTHSTDAQSSSNPHPDEEKLVTRHVPYTLTDTEYDALVQEPAKDAYYRRITTESDLNEFKSPNPKKHTTACIYIAGDNDLHPFAWRNIKQMERVGSNEHVNIIVQINTPGYFNPTRRYIVKNSKRVLVPATGYTPNQKMNSGSPHTLIDFMDWAVRYYPADNYALILWDHGTGAIDPGIPKTFNTTELYNYNQQYKKIELNRSISFFDHLAQKAEQEQAVRGICFDETFKSYMTNQDLEFALHEISTNILNGKKIDVLGFDACLMAMASIASIAKHYAHYMITSEEVEYGTGWDYELVFKPFLQRALAPKEFAQHIVDSYHITYSAISLDYTQSAFDLSHAAAFELAVDQFAEQVITMLDLQANHSVTRALRVSKSPRYCICFDEPTYIDIYDFLENLLKNINSMQLLQDTNYHKNKLAAHAHKIQECIQRMIIAKTASKNMLRAGGVSIYFPEYSIAHSYLKGNFALTNHWSVMMTKYILS